MTDKQRASFDELMTCELKTGYGLVTEKHIQSVLAVYLSRQCRLFFHLLVWGGRSIRAEAIDSGQRYAGSP